VLSNFCATLFGYHKNFKLRDSTIVLLALIISNGSLAIFKSSLAQTGSAVNKDSQKDVEVYW